MAHPSKLCVCCVCRALAQNGVSPPLGAAPSPARLMSFFARFCTPHPKTWGALLQGFVVSGDRGNRIFKTLRTAMSQPYNYIAMSGLSPAALDAARSRIVAQLLRGVLAAPDQGSRLSSVSAAAAAILEQDVAQWSSSNSAQAAMPSTVSQAGVVTSWDVSEAAAKRAAVLNVAAAAAGGHGSSWLPAVQQGVPGVPLQQQPAYTRLKVVVLLQILQVLEAWGVTIRHDAALAAALQVLRFCWDTEDARQSGKSTPASVVPCCTRPLCSTCLAFGGLLWATGYCDAD